MNPKTKKVLQLGSTGETEIVEKVVKEIDKKTSTVGFLAQASEIGFSIALPIALGAVFGLWLDSKSASHPRYTLSFLFLGIIIGFANLFYIVKVFSKKEK